MSALSDLFAQDCNGLRQLHVLSACLSAADETLKLWQRMTHIDSLTDERIKFSIDAVMSNLEGRFTISQVLWTLQELEQDFGLIKGAGDLYENLRIERLLYETIDAELA